MEKPGKEDNAFFKKGLTLGQLKEYKLSPYYHTKNDIIIPMFKLCEPLNNSDVRLRASGPRARIPRTVRHVSKFS
jgi:hypothetical protein